MQTFSHEFPDSDTQQYEWKTSCSVNVGYVAGPGWMPALKLTDQFESSLDIYSLEITKLYKGYKELSTQNKIKIKKKNVVSIIKYAFEGEHNTFHSIRKSGKIVNGGMKYECRM